jgi:hypothetical protein
MNLNTWCNLNSSISRTWRLDPKAHRGPLSAASQNAASISEQILSNANVFCSGHWLPITIHELQNESLVHTRNDRVYANKLSLLQTWYRLPIWTLNSRQSFSHLSDKNSINRQAQFTQLMHGQTNPITIIGGKGNNIIPYLVHDAVVLNHNI